jgi:hypothetical protein
MLRLVLSDPPEERLQLGGPGQEADRLRAGLADGLGDHVDAGSSRQVSGQPSVTGIGALSHTAARIFVASLSNIG